jgi:signal transduction histidine kinase
VALKIVIYRIVESTLKNLALHAAANQVHLRLQLADAAVVLLIDESPRDSNYASASTPDPAPDLRLQFAEARERTTLSGGIFSVCRNGAGGVKLECSWVAASGAASVFQTAGLPQELTSE